MFENEVRIRFGPPALEDFDEALSRIKQTGTFRDYQREFEKLGSRVRGWTPKALVGTFIGGLKPEISDGIRMFQPKSVKEVITFAKMRDDRLNRQRRVIRTSIVRTSVMTNQTNQPAAATPIKRMSWEEMQKRRAQGLCFNCNEKFTPGHKCQISQLLLLESFKLDEEKFVDEHQNDGKVECMAIEDVEQIMEPEITLHALAGWSAPRTLRIKVAIGSHELVALVDSGFMHNFISELMESTLSLPVTPTEPFSV